MTITFVLPFINLTGGIRVLLDYANRLHDAGHQVTVVYPCWPYRFQYTRQQQWVEFKKHLEHDGQVWWLPLRCRLKRVPFVHSAFLDRADLVIAAGWPVVHDVTRLSRSRGKKVQIMFHHESGTGNERRILATYQLPFYRVAFSRMVRQTIQDRFQCKVHDVVPNGVDTDVFFPDGAAEPRTVLWLYHPDPRKGAADGLAALTRLRERMPDVNVCAVGPVRPPELPSWMPFEFYPDDATLRRHYSTSTVLLYPSRYEGFGLPPLEAMACGCPSVTTAVGAIPEYATDNRDAAIVEIGDVGAMATRLEALLKDAPMRARLAAEGLKTADRYSLDRVAPLFEAALLKANDAI